MGFEIPISPSEIINLSGTNRDLGPLAWALPEDDEDDANEIPNLVSRFLSLSGTDRLAVPARKVVTSCTQKTLTLERHGITLCLAVENV